MTTFLCILFAVYIVLMIMQILQDRKASKQLDYLNARLDLLERNDK